MSTGAAAATGDLAYKITKLVEEKGWNQEDFARISNLNRHTVRQILLGGPSRRLRNATVSQCAEALGLTVNELRTLPVEKLLPRMHGKAAADEEALKLLEAQATLPELVSWLERNRDRTTELRPDEAVELLDMQNPGGPLERLGVEHCVDLIERRRALLAQVRSLTGTEYFECLERIVGLMAEKVAKANRSSRTI
ncbi:MAG: helix-turn-helix transcriptional regulator [Gemmataceae bacterium]